MTLVHFHVLSVRTVLDRRTQSSAHSASSECIRGAAVSRAELLQTQTMFAQGVVDGRTVTQVDVDGTLLGVEASFCYLGDMLSAGGGCSLAIITRCCTARGKFKKLLPILTSKAHIPHSSWEGV